MTVPWDALILVGVVLFLIVASVIMVPIGIRAVDELIDELIETWKDLTQ